MTVQDLKSGYWKVWVGDDEQLLVDVQNELFSLGIMWMSESKSVSKDIDSRKGLIIENGNLLYDSSIKNFNDFESSYRSNTTVQPAEIFAMAKEKIKVGDFVKIVDMGKRYPTISPEIFKNMKPYFDNASWVNVSSPKDNVFNIDEAFFNINIPHEVIGIVRHPHEPLDVMLIVADHFSNGENDSILAIGEEGIEKVKSPQSKPTIETADVQSQVFKILNTNDKNRIEQIDTLFRENSVFEEFNTNFGDEAYLLLDEIMDLLKDSEKKQTKKKPTKKKKKDSVVTKVGEKVEIKPKKKTKKQIKEDEDLESLLLELEDTDVTAIADADIDLEDLLNSI